MTREFNKQRRDDSRPSFRNTSSNRFGEERSPRSTSRPRLNREIVDRAWESGAQQQHADYRPRNPNGQPTRSNWQHPQRPGSSSERNGYNDDRRSHHRRDTYQDHNRRSERDSYEQNGPRSHSSTPYGRTFGDQRPENGRGFSNRRNGYAPQQDFRGNGQGRNSRYEDRPPQYRSQRGEMETDQRPPYRRPSRGYTGENTTPNRRPQSSNRPWERRGGYGEEYKERFEGDYERFNSEESRTGHNARPSSFRSPRNQQGKANPQQTAKPERHVTQMPDGRVLKGPRPAQRKNAQFWTEVSEDTDDLLNQIHLPTPEEVEKERGEDLSQSTERSPKEPATRPRKPRGSAAARSKSNTVSPKPRSTGPRPSQRGFKWPAS